MGIEQNTHNPHFGWNNPVRTTQLLQIARLSSKRDYFRMAREPGTIRESRSTSRLVVIYLDRDMEFVWTLKHLHMTSWQWSSSAQIKPLQPKFLSFQ